jgi:hypothetical protein
MYEQASEREEDGQLCTVGSRNGVSETWKTQGTAWHWLQQGAGLGLFTPAMRRAVSASQSSTSLASPYLAPHPASAYAKG